MAPRRAPPFAVLRRQRVDRLAASEAFERRVETFRHFANLVPVLGLVEPREVGEQQAAIEPPPPRDLLAVVEHRLLDPVERAIGEHVLDMRPRHQHRRIPRQREIAAGAAVAIDRLRSGGDNPARRPHTAPQGERFEEADLLLAGEVVLVKSEGVFGHALPPGE
jgi:hypothetical protein